MAMEKQGTMEWEHKEGRIAGKAFEEKVLDCGRETESKDACF